MGFLGAHLKRAASALLLLALPVASVAQDAIPGRANPALWRVHSATSTVYLFGSLHILPPGYPWRTPAIDGAMSAADLFIFEVPVDEDALKDEKDFIVQNGLLPSRQSLRGLLTQNEFQTYSAVLRRAGLRPEQFERYRPWLAGVMLGLAYLHRDELTMLKGADDDVMDYARAQGRPLLYLESMRQQMELLTASDDKSQLKSLKRLIVGLPRTRTQEKELRDLWSSGDAKRFTAVLEGYFEGRPEAKDWLIDSRNRTWVAAFRKFLSRPGGTTMITVGSAHVGGAQGLLALLCHEGYGVERVGNRGEAIENSCGPES
jgi:hypothetical protein